MARVLVESMLRAKIPKVAIVLLLLMLRAKFVQNWERSLNENLLSFASDLRIWNPEFSITQQMSCVEYFAGCARATEGLTQKGFWCHAHDIKLHRSMDWNGHGFLSRPFVFLSISYWFGDAFHTTLTNIGSVYGRCSTSTPRGWGHVSMLLQLHKCVCDVDPSIIGWLERFELYAPVCASWTWINRSTSMRSVEPSFFSYLCRVITSYCCNIRQLKVLKIP